VQLLRVIQIIIQLRISDTDSDQPAGIDLPLHRTVPRGVK